MATLRHEKVATATDNELLRIEIENKSKPCNNSNYNCTLPRLDGFEYCFRHILHDNGANYKQCAFAYPNGKKCRNALPKYDLSKDPTLTLCFEHSRQAQLSRTRAAVGRYKQVDTNDVLLNSLTHHIHIEEKKQPTIRANQDDVEIDVESPHEEIFVGYKNINGIDATSQRPKRRRILDYASDSSNDLELNTLRNTANCYEFDNSDADSVDSTDEDLLKHAEIYTRQEILRLSEAKLTKLQSLYIEQINQLHHLLKDRRRKYLLALRKEREILCSIHDQIKDSPRERKLYKQLKAYNTYHQKNGIEAVLHKKLKEKRAKVGDTYGYKPPSFTKCHFAEGGVKCTLRALPCCKFCRKHILEDKKQTLFRACSVDAGGVICKEAIPCIFDDSTCILHMPLPLKKHYVQKKNDSETEEEENSLSAADASVKLEKQDDEEFISTKK